MLLLLLLPAGSPPCPGDSPALGVTCRARCQSHPRCVNSGLSAGKRDVLTHLLAKLSPSCQTIFCRVQ